MLHVQHWIPFPDGFRPAGAVGLYVVYPLIPWIGVMALGYVFGHVAKMEPSRRDGWFLRLGAVTTLLFVFLRFSNLYGDPSPWASHARGAGFTFLDFLNTTKYPPSLLFLCMTLGPALLALAGLERWRRVPRSLFVTFGRVPLFFYLLHIPLIHIMTIVHSGFRYLAEAAFTQPDYRVPPELSECAASLASDPLEVISSPSWSSSTLPNQRIDISWAPIMAAVIWPTSSARRSLSVICNLTVSGLMT